MITMESPVVGGRPSPPVASPLPQILRSAGLAVALWCYGLSITVMLVGLWGRAVTTDGGALAEAAAEVTSAAVVSDRVVAWVLDAAAADGVEIPAEAEEPVLAVLAEPAARHLLEGIVERLVTAAMASPGEVIVVDLAGDIAAVMPQLRAAAAELGEPEAVRVVEEIAAGLEPIRLETGPASPMGAGLSSARAALRAAAVIAGGSAAGLAALSMVLSSERRRTARSLAVRSALSGIGFAAMLRLGSWALDPVRGGSDVGPSLRRAASVLTGSSLHVPLIVGLAGFGASLALRRRRSRCEPPTPA